MARHVVHGKRVQKNEGGATVQYINRFYEKNVTNGEVTTYYYLGDRLVALRKGSTVEYIHADHLTGTAATTNTSAAQVGSIRYLPYGSTKSTTGTLNTKYKYTGEELDATGLYDISSGYDPGIGRMVAAPYTYKGNSPYGGGSGVSPAASGVSWASAPGATGGVGGAQYAALASTTWAARTAVAAATPPSPSPVPAPVDTGPTIGSPPLQDDPGSVSDPGFDPGPPSGDHGPVPVPRPPVVVLAGAMRRWQVGFPVLGQGFDALVRGVIQVSIFARELPGGSFLVDFRADITKVFGEGGLEIAQLDMHSQGGRVLSRHFAEPDLRGSTEFVSPSVKVVRLVFTLTGRPGSFNAVVRGWIGIGFPPLSFRTVQTAGPDGVFVIGGEGLSGDFIEFP